MVCAGRKNSLFESGTLLQLIQSQEKVEITWQACLICICSLVFMQVRVEIQRAKLELLFELHRLPTEEEIVKKVGISPERYHEVMKAGRPVFSLHSRHATTQEEYIKGIADVDGVGADNWRQPALLRIALDDVVITHPPQPCISFCIAYFLLFLNKYSHPAC